MMKLPAVRSSSAASRANAGRRARLAFALASLSCPLAATAQALPWIGLTGHGAHLVKEEAQDGHGPGVSDLFGHALAAGDFDGDGHDDLVAASPWEDCAAGVDCGLVQVRFGQSTGARGRTLTLDPAAAGALDPGELGDHYGLALAVGDFNADGHADLAVGAPLESLGMTAEAGAVQIHYGLPSDEGGLQALAEHFLQQETPGVGGENRNYEGFGRALAVGDFNGDGHDDLAIGAPLNHADGVYYGGNVVVTHGNIGGLMPVDAFEMRLGLQGLPDVPAQRDAFGQALAAGDFNRDGYDDLAIGVPGKADLGAVLVVYGSPNSLIFANHTYFSRWDLNQTLNPGARFGDALAAGDFDGDGYDDLAIGEPRFDGDGAPYVDMGIVSVVFGGAAGIAVADRLFLWEDRQFGAGNSEEGDFFGGALAAADFDGDGVDDLAIGIAHEGGIANDSGAVAIVRGDQQRVLGSSRRLQPGHPPRDLVPDDVVNDSNYGAALAAGDFDGNGYPDLAIGAPYRNAPEDPVDAGAVAVLYAREQSLFEDTFERIPES